MLSFKRFFSITALILFLIVTALFYVPSINSLQLKPINLNGLKSKLLSDYINKNLSYDQLGNFYVSKVTLPLYNPAESKVIEIEESIIHRVSLIYYKAGKLHSLNWYKCNPNNDVNLNTNPYFTFEKDLPKDIYIVTAGALNKNVPVKLHNLKSFYLKKSNQEIIRIIIVILLVLIILCSLFVYIKLRNGYSLYLSIYMLLCLGSSLLFNGFANNLGFLDTEFFYDHSFGIMLSMHTSAMALFVYFLFRRTEKIKKYQFLGFVFAASSIFLILLCFRYDSYLILKYVMSFSLLINFVFISLYPYFFTKYQNKNAYWINYFAAILSFIFFGIFLLKIFNIINGSFTVEIIEKLLFVGHIVSLFTAFILINKVKMIDSYLNERGKFKYPVKEKNLINNEVFDTKAVLDLSNREYKVFELIAKGHKDQEIAELLYISISTVKTHKQRLYKKLNVNSRSQATQIFLNYTSKTYNFIAN